MLFWSVRGKRYVRCKCRVLTRICCGLLGLMLVGTRCRSHRLTTWVLYLLERQFLPIGGNTKSKRT